MKFSELLSDKSNTPAIPSLSLTPAILQRHEALMAALSENGTLVRRLATVLNAAEAADPLRWTTNVEAAEFVFPPQAAELSLDASYYISREKGGEVKRMDQRFAVGAQKVHGRLILQYCGVSKPPTLTLSDVHPGGSEIPDQVAAAIRDTQAAQTGRDPTPAPL